MLRPRKVYAVPTVALSIVLDLEWKLRVGKQSR